MYGNVHSNEMGLGYILLWVVYAATDCACFDYTNEQLKHSVILKHRYH